MRSEFTSLLLTLVCGTILVSASFTAGDEALDRNLAIACINRHNCETICVRIAATAAKRFASKSALLDAFAAENGRTPLTDAHKLGVQFARRAACDKCALVYSNCDDARYRAARTQLFEWRSRQAQTSPQSTDTMKIFSFPAANSKMSSNSL